MAATFTWLPTYGAQSTEQPRVRRADFGNGSIDQAADGINPTPQVWDLNFSAPTSIVENIRTFLKTNGGAQWFNWTTPDGDAIKVVCNSWSLTYSSPAASTLRAQFQQTYAFP